MDQNRRQRLIEHKERLSKISSLLMLILRVMGQELAPEIIDEILDEYQQNQEVIKQLDILLNN